MPRKPTHSSSHPSLTSPRDAGQPSRSRGGFGPSFDGVLNGGESWMARRKASDASAKPPGAAAARGDSGSTETDSKEPDIREEDEVPQGDEKVDDKANFQHVERSLTMLSISNGDSATSKDTVPTPNVDTTVASLAAGPPPGLSDVTNVEWLYIDLEGKVQGVSTNKIWSVIVSFAIF
jgi:PERQ amino acid-rich with GYF domain-containing protein